MDAAYCINNPNVTEQLRRQRKPRSNQFHEARRIPAWLMAWSDPAVCMVG